MAVIDRATTSQRVTAAASIAPIYYDVQVTPGNTTSTLTENSMTIRVLDAPGGAPVSGYRGGIEMDSNLVLKNLVDNPWSPDYTFKAADGGQVRFDAFGFKNGGLGTVTVTDSDVVTRTGTSNTVDVEELHFAVVMGSLTTTVGVPQTMTVQVLDESNRLVPSYRGKVWLRSSDPKAALPDESVLGGADFTFKPGEGGQHTFNDVRFNTAGNQTITVEDADYAPRQTTGATVAAGAIHYDVVLTPALVGMGDPVTLTVRVLDESETPVAGYRNHVCLATTDPNASLPDEYVLGCTDYTFKASDAGVHTFYPVRFNNAGTYSVTVENSANPVYRGASNPITVKSVTLHAAVSPTTAFAGERPLALTVEARDADGNLVPEYRGAIVFEPSAASVGLPRGSYQFPDYTFTAADAGRHVFPNVGFNVAGQQSVTVRDTRNSNWRATSNAVTVNEVSFVTSITPTTVIAGDPVTLSVTVVDPATDATVTGYLGTIGLSTTLPSSYNQNYEFTSSNNGSAALSFSFGAGGAAQVSVYDLSYQPRRSAPTGVTVTPPPPPSPVPAGPAPAPYSIPENITRPSPVDPGWGLPILASKTYGSNEWRAFPPAAAVPATPGVRYLVSGSAMRVTDAPWWSTFYACPWLAWESSLTTSRPSGGGLNTPNYDPTASGFGLHACSGPISRDASWLWPSLSDPAPAGTQGVHLDIHTGGNSGGTFGFSAIPFGDERECDECNPAALGESLSVGDPIDTRTGEFYLTEADLRVQTAQQGDGLRFERSYNTLSFEDGPLGVGWTHTYNRAVKTLSGGFVTVRLAHGSYLLFKDVGGEVYAAAPGSRYALLKRPEGGWALVTTDRQVDLFDAQGRLVAQQDPNGNLVWMTYQAYSRNGESGTRLARVDAPGGRHLWLGYDYYRPKRLIQVADHSGRVVRYGYDQNGFLAVITDTLGGVSRYSYNGWLMVSKVDPAGATVFANDYDGASRVITQTNSLGQRLSLSYVTAADGITTTVRDQTGATTVYAYGTNGLLRQVIDPLGAATTYRNYTAARVPTESVDALGNVTRMAYDELGFKTAVTDALGYVNSFSYDTRHNLVATTDPTGKTTRHHYDAQNNLLSVVDPISGTVSYTYNSRGQVTSVTDQNGHTTQYGYDSVGQRVAITDALGSVTTFVYDDLGRVTATTDPLGNVTLNEYDQQDNLVRTIENYVAGHPQNDHNEHNLVTQYAYDRAGRETAITDTVGHVTRSEYDATGRLIKTIANYLSGQPEDYQGQYNLVTAYEYDAAGRQIKTVDQRGPGTRETRTFYDAHGRQTALVVNYVDGVYAAARSDEDIVTRYAYDANDNQVAVTDTLGSVTRTAYDQLNRPVAVVANYVDGLYDPAAPDEDLITRYGYDSHGNQSQVMDSLGRVTTYQYDALNRVTIVTNPLSGTMRYSYDLSGNRLSATDANNRTTAYAYDALGRVMTTTNAVNGYIVVRYDALGRRLSVRDANGNTTRYGYDALGRTVVMTDALSNTSRFTYDVLGNTLTETDGAGRMTRSEYDALSQPITITANYVAGATADADTNVTAVYSYDAMGRRTGVRDGNGNSTHIGYDALDRTLVITDALSHTTHTVYDGLGRRLSVTDGAGRTTSFEYDKAGRIIRTRDAAGVTTYSYDGAGNRVALVDAEGVEMRYGYDALDRLVSVTENYVDGISGGKADEDVVTRYGYDAAGNRTVVTNAIGYATTYTYDELNRLASERDPLGHTTRYSYDAVGNRTVVTDARGIATHYWYDVANRVVTIDYPGGEMDVTFGYDALGNPRTMSDGTGTTTYTYDDLDRLAQATDGAGQRVSYSYDAAGNRTRLIYPDGKVITSTYDLANRLATVIDWSNGRYTYAYNDADQLSALTYPNAVQSQYSYDGAGRLTALRYTTGAQSLATYAYTFDREGNHVAIAETLLAPGGASISRTITYSYDKLYRLTGASYSSGESFVYAYDAAGNRARATDATGTHSYVYDQANRLAQVDGNVYQWDANGNLLSDDINSYTYNAANRLTSITYISSTTLFAYDGIGNRVSQSSGGDTTRYTLDVAAELPEVIAATIGTSRSQYVQVSGQVLAQYDSGTWAYALPDHLGSVRQLTNGATSVLLAQSYEPFGGTMSSAGTATSPFGFTGEQTDATGLQYLRARYYALGQGRFLTQDTFAGFDQDPTTLHRYVYVTNNPIVYVDPTGNIPQAPTEHEGKYIHAVIQSHFLTRFGGAFNSNGHVEYRVPGASRRNPGKRPGYVDMVREHDGMAYEIEHSGPNNNKRNLATARAELDHYLSWLRKPDMVKRSGTGSWGRGAEYPLPDNFGLWPIGLDPLYNPLENPEDGFWIIRAEFAGPGILLYWAERLRENDDEYDYEYDPCKVEEFIRARYEAWRNEKFPFGRTQPLPLRFELPVNRRDGDNAPPILIPGRNTGAGRGGGGGSSGRQIPRVAPGRGAGGHAPFIDPYHDDWTEPGAFPK